MKHLKLFQTLLRCCTLLIAFNFIAFFAFSQDKETVLEPYEILATDAIGNPTFIDFISTKVKSDDESVYEFLKKVYGFDEHTTFVEETNSSFITNGVYTKKLNQYYKDLRADFGQLVITYKDNCVHSISGDVNLILDFSIIPVISEEDALQTTLQKINAEQYAWENEGFEQMLREDKQNLKATHYPKGQLVVIDKDMFKENRKPDIRLAYKFKIYSLIPFDNKEYYVDAHTKEIIYEESLIDHATGDADTKYSGRQKIETQFFNGSYRLRDYTRGNGIETYDMNLNPYPQFDLAVDFKDNDNFWSATEHDNPQYDNAALDAHWGSGLTYDYFLETFGRNGWDRNGGLIKNYIHPDLTNSIGNSNAAWIDGTVIYGDGWSGVGKPYTPLDIVAHEIGHGITRSDNSMRGTVEAKAIIEGLSDIWGAMVENYSGLPKDIYLHMGEVSSGRNMQNPQQSNQPTTYKGHRYDFSTQNGAGHHNSTILTHWFYILAEGKTGINDKGHTYDIQGIGKEKAAELVYVSQRRFNVRMNFLRARLIIVESAIDLFGANSDETKAVCSAWYAVGVGNNSCASLVGVGGSSLGEGGSGEEGDELGDIDVLCERTSKTYSLYGVASTSNVTWEVSPNLLLTSSGTLFAQIRTIGLGSAYVIATVNGVPIRQDIWIGEPQVRLRIDQTHPYQAFIHVEGRAGTDITKQGISSTQWQISNSTGMCTPELVGNSNSFNGWIQASCSTWATQLNITITNLCGTVQLTQNVTSDGFLGGSGDYPCYKIVHYLGYDILVPCGSTPPFLGLRQAVQQFSIYDYMGVHYSTYENTNIIPTSPLPLGLYFIKGIDKEGNLFTLKYLKK